MMLITGATGHVGGELLKLVAARGESLRAMTRRPDAARFPAGVEVVRGDYDDETSLLAALRGVDRVFVMNTQPVGAAEKPTHDLAMATACGRAGVRRVVKLSVLGGGGTDLSDPIARWGHESENAVRACGAEWTLLRPGRFMSNVFAWVPMLRRGNEISVPFATRRNASIDPADIAAVALAALTEDGHAGKAYELSGPESLSPAEEIEILARALDRPLRAIALPKSAARDGMLKYGMPAAVVDAALAQTETDRGSHVLPTVEQVTGRPARTFAEWVLAHLPAFQ